jgi:threonyl-tRNA synthetase
VDCAGASRRRTDLRAPARLRVRSSRPAACTRFRVDADSSNEKLGYKIRHWKTQKVPYILVVGKSEMAEGTVNVNERGVEAKRTVPIDAFAEELAERVTSRR